MAAMSTNIQISATCWARSGPVRRGRGDRYSQLIKVEDEDLATPGCQKMEKARRYVGDTPSAVRTPWLAFDETPGP